MAFILAQIPPPEAAGIAACAPGERVFIRMNGRLPPLCRPSGWTCLWRTIGNLSVLNRLACVA